MAARCADASQRDADDMDRKLFDAVERAYARGWVDVARSLNAARVALRPRLHPEDRKIAANA